MTQIESETVERTKNLKVANLWSYLLEWDRVINNLVATGTFLGDT